MKSTGIVRNLDVMGRLVLPKELRKVYNLKESEPVEIFTDGNKIIITKYEPACILCGDTKELITDCDKYICSKCIEHLYAKKEIACSADTETSDTL